MSATPRLHSFFNSSAAFRVRIALNLKGLDWDYVAVGLRAGEHNAPPYRALNPFGLVPTFEHEDVVLGQSLAIIDYLDRVHPEPLMVPQTGAPRDRVLQIALSIACDIHPINNLRVLKYLTGTLGLDERQKTAWMHHWISLGFNAVEALLEEDAGAGWCVGAAPTLADCCLVPQVANAERAGFDFAAFPRIRRIADFCMTQPAFAAAAPAAQPDFIDS